MPEKLRRADVNDTTKMSLLCEVNCKCPLCNKILLSKKNKKNVRVFDVTHIYPLNATKNEKEILQNEAKLSENIDCEENFIALCKICHKTYDTNKTVDEYRQLFKIKQDIKKFKELRIIWDMQTLHKDIAIVANDIGKLNKDEINSNLLSFEALKLSEKKDETLDIIHELKIIQYITNFYIPIRKSFKKLEKEEKVKSTFIYSQVKSYYLMLCMKNYNQIEIFKLLSEWFTVNTGIIDYTKAEVLVSYFIQNCEVYSNVGSK